MLAIAWPMALKAVILQATIVIDAWLVAGLGETALAGLGLAAAVAGVALSAIFAFASALQIRTAQAEGTGDATFLRSTLGAGLAVSGAIGAVSAVFLLITGTPILTALAPVPEAADLASDYLRIFVLVILGEALGQVLSSHFNGRGRPKVPLVSFALSLPVNVALSAALIHGAGGLPEMGVAGAAWGSVVAVAIQVGVMAAVLWRDGPRATGWQGGGFGPALGRHLAFVAPIATTFLSAGVAINLCNLLYTRMPLQDFAAMTLVVPWVKVAGAIGMQWAQGSGIVVAQLLGRRRGADDLDRFLSGAWRAGFVVAAGVAAIYAAVLLSVDWLYPTLAPGTRAIASGLLPLAVVLPILQQTNAICGNTLRASGDTIYVMNLFLASQWAFKVPATALAVLVLDLPAFWVFAV
ncbi:MAG: MATE family efflux transporter, partial [Pseudomonadota bacterium]